MSAFSSFRRRPATTYGRKPPPPRGFGWAADEDEPTPAATSSSVSSRTTHQNQNGLPAPTKVRRIDPSDAKSATRDIFDVTSSEDELVKPVQSPPSISPRRKQQPGSVTPHAQSPQTTARLSFRPAPPQASDTAVRKRKRAAKNNIFPEPLSPSSSDLAGDLDSSNHTSPRGPATPTPEPGAARPSTPQTLTRATAATTPRQSQLWKDLLDESESDSDPARHLQKLRLQSTVKRGKAASPSLPTRQSRRLVDSMMRPDDSSEIGDSSMSVRGDDSSSVMDVDMGGIPSSPRRAQQSFMASVGGGGGGPRITYAQQRSYLQETTNSLEDMLSQPLDDAFGLPDLSGLGGGSKPAKQQDAAVDLANDDDDENEATGSGFKNIHELRAAGDARRFHDETSNLLEDVDTSLGVSVSGRRSAYMTLAAKLNDGTYKARFVQSAYDAQLFAKSRGETDAICLAGAAATALILLQAPTDSQSASHGLENGLVDVLSEACGFEKDVALIAKDRKTNMSKAAQRSVGDFADMMKAAALLVDVNTACISPQRMALMALEALVRRCRENGRNDSILTAPLLDRLLQVGDVQAFSPETTRPLQWHDAKTVMSCIESATVSSACAGDAGLWNHERMQAVSARVEVVVRGQGAAWEPLRPLALRLCLNLANNNEANSDEFARASFLQALLAAIREGLEQLPHLMAGVDAEDEAATRAFDNLLLALGTMINLAELSRAVRAAVERDARATFDALVKLFARGREQAAVAESLAASRAAVAFGYLAILLANLALHARLRARTAALLPNGQVAMLVDAVEEFLVHHREADRRAQDSSEWAAFTGRLQAVADALKEVVV